VFNRFAFVLKRFRATSALGDRSPSCQNPSVFNPQGLRPAGNACWLPDQIRPKEFKTS
jgi:hypothetical protein